jgi:hypothetical protein
MVRGRMEPPTLGQAPATFQGLAQSPVVDDRGRNAIGKPDRSKSDAAPDQRFPIGSDRPGDDAQERDESEADQRFDHAGLIAIIFRLVGSLDVNVEVFGLFLRERGELDAELL